jgi:hypothetical protein
MQSGEGGRSNLCIDCTTANKNAFIDRNATKPCETPECGRARAKNSRLCGKCLGRKKRGEPLPDTEYTLFNDRKRLKELTAPTPTESGCLLWLGPADRKGYGRITSRAFIKTSGSPVNRAHVLSLCLKLGRNLGSNPTTGRPLEACHTCDTPACVEPSHLFEGSRAENHADAMTKGRHAHGETHGMSKLSEADVLEILERVQSGESQSTLAARYQVSKTQVSAIISRKSWKHLYEPPEGQGH